MSCRSIESDLVDVARGVNLPGDRGLAVERHVRECSRCAARIETEHAMSAGLRRLANTRLPVVDPARERTEFAAFDAAWSATRERRWSRPAAAAAAALLALAASIALAIVNMVPHSVSQNVPRVAHEPAGVAPTPHTTDATRTLAPRRAAPSQPIRPRRHQHGRPPAIAPAPTEFVVWPGAADLPTFESGHLMRMELPMSVVASLGLRPSSVAPVVQADVLVGQDGYARGVRLVP